MPSWVVIGPGDDAAVVKPQRGTFDVLTTDAQVDGVHFDRRFVPAEAIGHRALAVNVSDLAAMGASPHAALLSLALPPTLDVATFEQVLDGLLALAADSPRHADRGQHHADPRAPHTRRHGHRFCQTAKGADASGRSSRRRCIRERRVGRSGRRLATTASSPAGSGRLGRGRLRQTVLEAGPARSAGHAARP